MSLLGFSPCSRLSHKKSPTDALENISRASGTTNAAFIRFSTPDRSQEEVKSNRRTLFRDKIVSSTNLS